MMKTIAYWIALFLLMALQTANADSTQPTASDAEAYLQKSGIQPAWAACKKDSDCSLFETVCGLKMAANTQYVDQARSGYCALHNGCVADNCNSVAKDATSQLTYQMGCYYGYCLAAPDNQGALLQKAGIQPAWAACKQPSDCGLFPIMCGMKMAANAQYLSQAQKGFCAQHNGCSSDGINCPSPEVIAGVTYQIICTGYCLASPNVPH